MNDSSKIFDGLLVLEYRSGSKKALGVLVKKYHLKLCRHAWYYTKDLDAAKDIVQDSWSVMLAKLHTLKEPNHFGSWAFRIVTRKALNFVKQNNTRTTPLGEKDARYKVEEHTEESGTQGKRLKEQIAKLPENQQVVLKLFYTESYTLIEISDILCISVGTVKSRLFHAREKLKSSLKQKI